MVKSISFRDSQLLKTYFSISLRELGNFIYSNDTQSSKAPCSIISTLSKKNTLLSKEQPLKALTLIFLTKYGIFIVSNFLQSTNASISISSTLFGIIIFLNSLLLS